MKERSFFKLLFSLIIGFSLLLMSLDSFILENNLIKERPEVLGKIKSKYEVSKRNELKKNPVLYWLEYEYIGLDGEVINSGKVEVNYDIWRKYKVGETIVVIYEPENGKKSAPKEIYLESLSDYKTVLLISFIIFCLTIVNFFIFIKKQTEKRRFKSA